VPFAIHIWRNGPYGVCLFLLTVIACQAPEDFRNDKPFRQREFFITDNCPDGNPWVVPIEENLVEPFQPTTIASHRLSIEPLFERGKDIRATERLDPYPAEEVVHYKRMIFEPGGNLLLSQNLKVDVMFAQPRLRSNNCIRDFWVFNRMRSHDLEGPGFVAPLSFQELVYGIRNVGGFDRR
jgi:hypothetical protein